MAAAVRHRAGEAKNVVIVGTERGLEARLVPASRACRSELIRVAGLKGIGGMKLLRNAALLPAGLWDSEKIIRRHRFDVGVRRRRLRFRPDDARRAASPNSRRRLRAERRARFHESHSRAHRHARCRRLRGDGAALRRKAVVTGIPVRPRVLCHPAQGAHARRFKILITGGSRGALPINRAVIDSLDLLAARKNQLFIVHQTGERDYNAVRVAYARREFQSGGLPLHRKYGGAVRPGRPDRLPVGCHHRRGNICRRTRRHLHPFRRRHRRSPNAQRARPCKTPAPPGSSRRTN